MKSFKGVCEAGHGQGRQPHRDQLRIGSNHGLNLVLTHDHKDGAVSGSESYENLGLEGSRSRG